MRRWTLVIAMLATSPCAAADVPSFGDGNELYSACDGAGDPNFYACMGFIRGTIKGYELGSIFTKSSLCMPRNATYKQVLDVVVKRLRDYPEQRQIDAGSIVVGSLIRAFPCPPSPPSSSSPAKP